MVKPTSKVLALNEGNPRNSIVWHVSRLYQKPWHPLFSFFFFLFFFLSCGSLTLSVGDHFKQLKIQFFNFLTNRPSILTATQDCRDARQTTPQKMPCSTIGDFCHILWVVVTLLYFSSFFFFLFFFFFCCKVNVCRHWHKFAAANVCCAATTSHFPLQNSDTVL